MPGLIVLAPPAQGAHFGLTQARDTVIGRDGFCDVVLPKRTVSRKHARVFFSGENYRIEDLGSSHGTFVNGKKVVGAFKLHDGDRINVYDIPIAFVSSEESILTGATQLLFTSNGDIGGQNTSPPPPSNLRIAHTSYFNGRLKSLVEITRRLGSSLAIDEILPRILDLLFEMFPQAAMGEIQVVDTYGRLNPVAMKHGRDDDSSIVTRVPVGNDIAKQVLQSGQPILRLADDARLESVLDEGIPSIVCVPILGPSLGKLGTILLESDDEHRSFTEGDVEIVASVGIVAGQAIEYARSHRTLLRMDQTQRQLDTARQIQLRMLPQKRPTIPGYSFYEYYSPALSVGGDYYFWDALPDGRLIMGVADACGKALPAALMIAQFATEVRHCIATAKFVKVAMSSLNHFVRNLDEGFITFCLIIVDPKTNLISIANAGHPSPLCRRDKTGLVEDLGAGKGGLPLGIDESEEYHPIAYSIEPGDQIVLFTDGITETMSPNDGLFGSARLRSLMARSIPDLKSRIDTIVNEVQLFRGDRNPSDDSCLIALARNLD